VITESKLLYIVLFAVYWCWSSGDLFYWMLCLSLWRFFIKLCLLIITSSHTFGRKTSELVYIKIWWWPNQFAIAVYCRMVGLALMALFTVSRCRRRVFTTASCQSVNGSLQYSLVCQMILRSVFIHYRHLCCHGNDWMRLLRQLFAVIMLITMYQFLSVFERKRW